MLLLTERVYTDKRASLPANLLAFSCYHSLLGWYSGLVSLLKFQAITFRKKKEKLCCVALFEFESEQHGTTSLRLADRGQKHVLERGRFTKQ